MSDLTWYLTLYVWRVAAGLRLCEVAEESNSRGLLIRLPRRPTNSSVEARLKVDNRLLSAARCHCLRPSSYGRAAMAPSWGSDPHMNCNTTTTRAMARPRQNPGPESALGDFLLRTGPVPSGPSATASERGASPSCSMRGEPVVAPPGGWSGDGEPLPPRAHCAEDCCRHRHTSRTESGLGTHESAVILSCSLAVAYSEHQSVRLDTCDVPQNGQQIRGRILPPHPLFGFPDAGASPQRALLRERSARPPLAEGRAERGWAFAPARTRRSDTLASYIRNQARVRAKQLSSSANLEPLAERLQGLVDWTHRLFAAPQSAGTLHALGFRHESTSSCAPSSSSSALMYSRSEILRARLMLPEPEDPSAVDLGSSGMELMICFVLSFSFGERLLLVYQKQPASEIE
eukprot:scaffold518_cov388-Prasinococcus_capsulatus_cf.AAC.38